MTDGRASSNVPPMKPSEVVRKIANDAERAERGRYINEHATIGMRLTQLRAELPEVEKQARKTPRKDLLDEVAKVHNARARVPNIKREIASLETEHAGLRALLVRLGHFAPADEDPHCVGKQCGECMPGATPERCPLVQQLERASSDVQDTLDEEDYAFAGEPRPNEVTTPRVVELEAALREIETNTSCARTRTKAHVALHGAPPGPPAVPWVPGVTAPRSVAQQEAEQRPQEAPPEYGPDGSERYVTPAHIESNGQRVHHLKCWPIPYAGMRDGRKTFEFRKWDRDYRVGDVLLLHEYDPETKKRGGLLWREVTYLLPGGNFGVPLGYCVLGLASMRELESAPRPDKVTLEDRERVRRMRSLLTRANAMLERYMPDLVGERAVLTSMIRDACVDKWDDGEWEPDEDEGPAVRLDYPRAEIDALRSAARACVNARCTDRLRVAEAQDALFAALTILDDILEDAPCSDSPPPPEKKR